MELPDTKQDKIKLAEINEYLTCYLCKGYLINATTITECLHSFCRSCIIKFLQDNSYCPVCELIINKAKPNLKLDKTKQDIVYKLVPELFSKEMLRRKSFYKDHPQVAARVSPEERGEDTERTIFSPQEMISLSLEYICDDSTPGAIRIPGIATDPETLKPNGTADENQDSQMKRYLLCPGMCRVEVLKKFVRNKYNVDTNQFFIDILYKRVPLPDHYTLIDIAYIYSWQRNELMKFFFRIIDQSKARNADSPVSFMPQFVPRSVRRCRNSRKTNTDRKSAKKSANKAKDPEIRDENAEVKVDDDIASERLSEKVKPLEEVTSSKLETFEEVPVKVKQEECNATPSPQPCRDKEPQPVTAAKKEVPNTLNLVSAKVQAVPIKKEPLSPEIESLKQTTKVISKPVTKSYTSITLNRSENVEIITKIEPVSTKDGRPIGHHIIKQTIKKGSNKFKSPRKFPKTQLTIPKLVITKKNLKKLGSKSIKSELEPPVIDDEKARFFAYMGLAPTRQLQKVKQETPKPVGGQKRKSTSPTKSDKSPKISKLEPNKLKLILQEKPSNGLQSLISSCKIPSSLSITIKEGSDKDSVIPTVVPPVKNFIEILKLPEEAATSAGNKPPALDFSKFCDNDSEQKVDQDLAEIAKSLTEKIPMSTTVSQIVGPKPQFQIPVKTNIPGKPQIQPAPVPEISKALKLTPRSPQTFQKIFEESLKKPPEGPKTAAVEVIATEAGPSIVTGTGLMWTSSVSSTSVSSTSVSNTAVSPSSVCNTSVATTSVSSTSVSNSSVSTTSVSTTKKNIMEIASQLFKKTKLKLQEGPPGEGVPSPKVPIPRLPISRTPKLVPQTVASLHSTSLGMNYTVSVGQQSPSKVMKSNGIVSPVKAESVPSFPECKPPMSPANELKSAKSDFKVPSPSLGSPKLPAAELSPKAKTPSPKSSPVVKHMYAPALPSSGAKPKLPTATTTTAAKTAVPKTSPSPTLTPNEILEKYNIQNLAQLTASFNLNPSVLATNQLAAFQHAMLLKHFEIQNRQNWLSRNQGPLLQYEKYLQSLNNGGLNGSHSQT